MIANSLERRSTMSNEREVVVLSGVRTAIGAYGGGLKDQPPTELAATMVREAVRRADIAPADVGHVVFGNVIHTEPHDMYLSRVAAVNGGLPVETKVKGGTTNFATDENVRRDTTLEKLSRLRPVFDKSGSVTAGNASSINDAAAAVVLMERSVA